MTGSEIYKKLAACPEFQTHFPMLTNYGTPVKYMTRKLIGREKQLRQLKAGLLRPELCNVLLLGDAGSGKCLSNDTLIPVADERGYVPISELKIGDKVFDEEGNLTTVLGVYPQGMKHAYSVGFPDGSKIVCNDEHLWNVRKRRAHHANKSYETMTLKDMMNYGIVHDLSSGKCRSFYIPMNRAVKREARVYPIHPYAIGVLLGDGSLHSESRLCVSSNDEYVVNKFADLIGAVAAEKSKYNYNWYFVRPNATDKLKYIQQKELADKCDFKDLFFKKSIDKRIPREYMYGSIEQRYDLLRGLMDTDGTVSGNDRCNCTYNTNNKLLAEDVQELVRSLGMRASISEVVRNDDAHKNIEYAVHICVSDDRKYQLFSLSRHKSKINKHRNTNRKHYRRYDDLAVSSVEDLNCEMEMTCIYVDSPSHLFQAGKEHIVTHNTALVQGAMAADTSRVYLEIDISKMIADLRDNNEMAVKIKALFDESAKFVRESGTEIVLFIDEFHLICMLSDAAVEALKPMLADSGTRGVRVIVATTFTEFRQYISANQPLVQRLQRIEILPPAKEAIVDILKSFAKIYGVADEIHGTYLYEQIIDLSNRYIPANSQPRKSILLLDLMVGWYRAEPGTKMDVNLLYDVLKYSEGIELNVHVDAVGIKKRLDSKVFAQYLATSAVASRLQITSADLNNKTKPMGSFLFTGSTGVGKRLDDNTKIPVYTPDGSMFYKRNGDLQVGDYVFNRKGKPVMVTEVFHYKDCEMLEVELTDGRTILADPEHLWQYKSRFGNGAKTWKVADTKTLMDKYQSKYYNNGRNAHNVKFVIPMNGAVMWDEISYKTSPYVIGAAIGNGCLTQKAFGVSSDDIECIAHISELIGAASYKKAKSSYTWMFELANDANRSNNNQKLFQTQDVLSEVSELIGLKSGEKFIPDCYKHGSVAQRWELIRGLFDTDGTISDDKRFNVSYSTVSRQLAYDVQEVLYSLGVSSSVNCHKRANKSDEYDVHVKTNNSDKEQFFYISRKRYIAQKAALFDADKTRVKKFGDVIGIRDIRETGIRCDATCIMVDDPEHLYQAGDFIVTHNTELTKQLAEILFADPKRLIRFDMTEYSQPGSIERFRVEVTTKVWERPYSVLLFDEIEKACGDVTRILLQVLDDGRLIDQNNREVSFLNTYIVLTTNAASEIYETVGDYVNDANMTEAEQIKALGKYMKVIRRAIVEGTGSNKFPPELLGRIDAICPFMPLSEETQRKILEKRMDKLRNEVEHKHGLKLSYATEDILRYILRDKLDTESNSGGARIVATKFEEEVVIEVARIINIINSDTDKELTHDNIIGIRVVVEGNMAVDDKKLLEGDAYIAAYPVNIDNKIIKTNKRSK